MEISPAGIEDALRRHGFVTTGELATTLFLAERLGKPLLLEGPPGVGKTETWPSRPATSTVWPPAWPSW